MIRNSAGDWVDSFVHNIGRCYTIIWLELWALFYGMDEGFRNVEVEPDTKTIVHMVLENVLICTLTSI